MVLSFKGRHLLLWQKLLLIIGSSMIVLSIGLMLTYSWYMNHLSLDIGVKARGFLEEKTEKFLFENVSGQSGTIDLQMNQAKSAILIGGQSVSDTLKTDRSAVEDQIKKILDHGGPFSTTIYYIPFNAQTVVYPEPPAHITNQITLLSDQKMKDVQVSALKLGAVQWCDVHQNPFASANDRVIDAVTPVENEGRIIGILGISISVTRLVAQFNHRQAVRGSYTFLLNKKMHLVAAPPHGLLELKPVHHSETGQGMIDLSDVNGQALKNSLYAMALGSSAVSKVLIKGREKYMAYDPLNNAGWRLGIMVPVSLATAESKQLTQIIHTQGKDALLGMVLVSFLLLGGVLTLIALISIRMMRPLNALATAADQISHGELDQTITIKNKDEMGVLANSFNHMAAQLKEKIHFLEFQQHQLMESESRYRVLFERSPVSLWEEDYSLVKKEIRRLRRKGVTDFASFFDEHPEKTRKLIRMIKVINVNEASLHLYGASHKKELLSNLSKIMVNVSHSVIRTQLIAIAENRMFEIECENQTLDGRTLNVMLRTSIPPGYEETWEKVFLSVFDLTSRVTVEKEKQALEEQLRQTYKMEAIGTLAGGIAHDFNNILFPILGYSEMLMNDLPTDTHEQKSARQIQTSALRARELVKQILTFSRQDNRKLNLIKIQPIVKEVIKLTRSTLPSTIEIKSRVEPDCSTVKADPTSIHQVLMNLITNAFHAMEETGGVLEIDLTQEDVRSSDVKDLEVKEGEYLCLSVRDTGVGMSKAVVEKSFDPFFTTKRKGKGTGMGLSVVHGIVTGMRGMIRVSSEPGVGTKFDVFFPIERGHGQRVVKEENGELEGGKEHILFVDDETVIVNMASELLNHWGYEVTAFTESFKALERFNETPDRFDLIVTDLTMPTMTGAELSAQVAKARPDIPILLCTGYSESISTELAEAIGINKILLKPIESNILLKEIRALLSHSKSQN